MADLWSDALTAVMRRFSGWMPWYGTATGRWWAMPPPAFIPQCLVDAATPDELAVAIGTASPYDRTAAPEEEDTSLPAGTVTRHSWRIDDQEMPVRAARRLTCQTLASWPVRGAGDAATLIVSELVSNAVRYAAPPISLALTLIVDGPSGSYEVLIEVTDADARLPTRRNPGESGGFGLSLVESLAKTSFVTSDSGKTVRALLITSADRR
jgi:hypothetical protein